MLTSFALYPVLAAFFPVFLEQKKPKGSYLTTKQLNLTKGDVTLRDSQQQFLEQHSVVTLLRHWFEWLQHCSNIVALSSAKNRRRESSRVTSP